MADPNATDPNPLLTKAEGAVDSILGLAMARHWTFFVLLGYGLCCAVIGGWIATRFCP